MNLPNELLIHVCFVWCVFSTYIYIYVFVSNKKHANVQYHWVFLFLCFLFKKKHIPCCPIHLNNAAFQALKAIRLQWHPDKQLDTGEVAGCPPMPQGDMAYIVYKEDK